MSIHSEIFILKISDNVFDNSDVENDGAIPLINKAFVLFLFFFYIRA